MADLVLDASAAVEIARGERPDLLGRIDRHDLHTPAHFDVEVLSALRRYERTEGLDAAAAFGRLDDLAVARYPVRPLLIDALRWADFISVPDCPYVALASQLACPLLTADRRLVVGAARAGVTCLE